jgi:hypothetical protein
MTASDQARSGGGQAPGTARTAWLTAHGRHPWATISSFLSGCTCAWADLDGFHAGPPPAGPPLATHLWAWSPDRLLRIRLDGSDGIAAELHLTDPGIGEPVQVTERDTATWPPGEGRVSADDKWRGRAVRIYQVAGLMPLEFARLDQAGAPAGQTAPGS